MKLLRLSGVLTGGLFMCYVVMNAFADVVLFSDVVWLNVICFEFRIGWFLACFCGGPYVCE